MDGQSEVTNRALEQYLRVFVYERSKRWFAQHRDVAIPSPLRSGTAKPVRYVRTTCTQQRSSGAARRAGGNVAGVKISDLTRTTVYVRIRKS